MDKIHTPLVGSELRNLAPSENLRGGMCLVEDSLPDNVADVIVGFRQSLRDWPR